MVRASVLTLIAEDPTAHGVFETYTPSERTVYCTVRSATYNDILASKSEGLRPEIVFRLSHDFEYKGEKICEYNGVRYNIDRTYVANDSDWIELTCSRGNADVCATVSIVTSD